MKKKTLAAMLILTVAFTLGACGSKSTSDDTSVAAETTQTMIDDGPMALLESALGYSVEYNTEMFTVTSTDVSDTFTYSGDEIEPLSNIYVAIQYRPDIDAEYAATGLATLSGQDVEASECTFGDDNEGYFLTYSEVSEDNDLTTNLTFYIVPKGEGCIILEIGNYDGYDSIEIDGNIELIIDSFKQEV
jgi:hypothetical protein